MKRKAMIVFGYADGEWYARDSSRPGFPVVARFAQELEPGRTYRVRLSMRPRRVTIVVDGLVVATAYPTPYARSWWRDLWFEMGREFRRAWRG